MKAFLLNVTVTASRVLGSWLMRFIAWWIATGYFFLRPSRLIASLHLYEAIFPHRGRCYHFYCAWRQFHSLAASYVDRIGLDGKTGGGVSSEGREFLKEADREGRGGIIIISHLGNYEVAARAFQELGLKLMMMMGEKEARHVARQQREDLKARGISIVVASAREETPFGGLEAIKHLREGGFVSLAGDVVWTDQRSMVQVKLLGREVRLSSAPYLLALISGAPLFTMFVFRVGRGKHRIIISPHQGISARSRSRRSAAVQASAQAYATALEQAVLRHPFQWYIFEPIFGPKLEDGQGP